MVDCSWFYRQISRSGVWGCWVNEWVNLSEIEWKSLVDWFLDLCWIDFNSHVKWIIGSTALICRRSVPLYTLLMSFTWSLPCVFSLCPPNLTLYEVLPIQQMLSMILPHMQFGVSPYSRSYVSFVLPVLPVLVSAISFAYFAAMFWPFVSSSVNTSIHLVLFH